MADSGIGQPQDPKATDSTSSWTVISLLKYIASITGGGGGGGGGGAVTVADGADVTQGTIADPAVVAGASGTENAHLRAISRDVGATATNGATATKQDTGNASAATTATQTTNSATSLASIDTKIPASPSTASNQTTLNTNIGTIGDAAVTAGASGSLLALLRTLSRDLIANIVLKASSAIIGQVGVDQTTPGTTDSVTVKASVGIGSLTEAAPASDTASSGLNGRLQRIAQRLTSILAGTPILPVNIAPTWTNIGANNTDGVASMDVSNYRSGSIDLSGTWSATVNVQFSNGSGNWYSVPLKNLNLRSSQAGATANGIYEFTIPSVSLMRIRTTAYTSGSVVANVLLSTLLPGEIDLAIIGSSTFGGGQLVVATGSGEGTSNNVPATWVGGYPFLYNTATWDRQRNNNSVSVLASTARTASANADVVTYNAKTFRVILNITAAPNTASTLTLSIREKDSISSNYITVLTGAVETGTVDTAAVPVTKTYAVGAGLVTTANISASEALARTMNVLVTHSNADSWTYSVSVELGV